jgi:hypothetical protein
VPKCCERWLIFDESGKLKGSGDYDSDDAISKLRNIVDGEYPYSEAVLWKMLDSLERRDLAQIVDSGIRSRSGKAIVVMISSVCTGCADGALIDQLNTFSKELPETSFLALVPNSFSKLDVKNLSTNLDITFSVERANQNLSQEWNLLNNKYGEKKINGTLILISEGKIRSVVNGMYQAGGIKQILKEFLK